MSKLKKRIKQDLITKTDVTFSFDTSKLESNEVIRKKPFNKRWLFLIVPSATVASLVLVVAGVVLANSITSHDSAKITRKKYSAAEIAVIESNTFKRLNSFDYPSLTAVRSKNMSEGEISAYNAFANTIYQNLDYEVNSAFAPVNLYPILSLLAAGSSSPELDLAFSDLFSGLNTVERTLLYQKVFKSNYYHNDLGTSLLHNGAFVDYAFPLEANYLKTLTDNYFETYSLDYKNESDISKMLAWVSEAMQKDGFMKKEDLKLNEETMLYFFSAFIFANQWQDKYYETKNTVLPFYLLDGSAQETTYMKHSYIGTYYDYDKYVSFYDYYTNNNMVQYIVPKSHDDSIYDLLGETSFLEETGVFNPNKIIELTAPIFDTSNTIDFKATLTKLGLGIMFDEEENNFAYMFNDYPLTSYIQQIGQKNEVSFSVDGTTIKSLSFAGMGAKSSAPVNERTLEVRLDQPFIYVIRDINNIPLFIGHYDGPER